jgi:ankyrin repeat protein
MMCLSKKSLFLILLISVTFVLLRAQDIHETVRAGDIKNVKTLLEKNPELAISKDANGRTPLELALFRGNKEAIDVLLRNDAQVRIKTKAAGDIRSIRQAVKVILLFHVTKPISS